MLRGIRKASENWLGRTVMGVVMALLAGSFAIWGINDIFRGFGRSELAKIGDTEIAIEQFRQTYDDRLQQIGRELGKPLSREDAQGLDRQVLGEMIAQAGLQQRARQMGLGLSDADIARHITSDPRLQTPNGQFDRARFELLLRSIGSSEQRFVADQRQEILRHQIIDTLSADIGSPKTWLEAVNEFRNQQRTIEFIALGPQQAGQIAQPTEEQLKKYFDDRKIMFRAPEYRKIAVVAVTPSELAKWMEVSDDDLKKAYEQRRASFTTPERRHVEQILFPNLAEAQTAADRIRSGASFKDIASDRGLKEQDIDLGTVPKSRIVEPAVADAAFALKQGEVSAPLQTRFGAAVLVTVLKIEPETTKSLAEVTSQLRSDVALERAKMQVRDLHDKIEDARAGGSTIEEATAKLKLPVETHDVDRSGRSPNGNSVVNNIPHGPEVIKAAFASDVGVDNDPIEADAGYVWYDVAAITPARPRELNEVKAEVEKGWRENEISSRLKNKADESLNKLNHGDPFPAIASAAGVNVETAKDLKRGVAGGGVPASATEAVFRTAKDGYGSAPGDDAEHWIVFRVDEIKTPPIDENSPDNKQVAQTVQRELTGDLTGQYIARLEDDLGTSVNTSQLAQATGTSAPDRD
jgi:peptidyl-prolyl cis-trans isomerase D